MRVRPGITRRLARLLKSALCVALLAATALVTSLVSSPAWAPEDGWRLLAHAPALQPRATSVVVLAQFLHENGVRLPPDLMMEIAEAVAEQSQRYGIDGRLLLSVMLSESTFRTDAVSAKGAIGLMQLLPSTAQEVAARLQLEWGGEVRLLDPHTNIALGSYYLRHLLDSFDGDLTLALTAYNMGPGTVQSMLKEELLQGDGTEYPYAYADRIVGRLPKPSGARRAVPAPVPGREVASGSAL